MNEILRSILFLLTILITHIIHGITGFAGTLLAMPFSIELISINVARPILNVLAIFSGFYVLANNYRSINFQELRKIVLVMLIGIIAGIYIKFLFVGNERLLMIFLGIFIIYLSLKGLKIFNFKSLKKNNNFTNRLRSNLLLIFAGIVH